MITRTPVWSGQGSITNAPLRSKTSKNSPVELLDPRPPRMGIRGVPNFQNLSMGSLGAGTSKNVSGERDFEKRAVAVRSGTSKNAPGREAAVKDSHRPRGSISREPPLHHQPPPPPPPTSTTTSASSASKPPATSGPNSASGPPSTTVVLGSGVETSPL